MAVSYGLLIAVCRPVRQALVEVLGSRLTSFRKT
jgi:hypothetical protein